MLTLSTDLSNKKIQLHRHVSSRHQWGSLREDMESIYRLRFTSSVRLAVAFRKLAFGLGGR